MRGAGSGSCCRRLWWLGAVLTACVAGAGAAHAQPFVYVSSGFGNVFQYDASGGALSPLSPTFVACNCGGFFAVVVSPDGKSVYVAGGPGFEGGPGAVSQFNVGADGVLTPKTPPTVASGLLSEPRPVAVSPDGKSVYVGNVGGNTVSQFDVGVGGVLTPKVPATVPSGSSPFAIAVSPDGKSVYVTDFPSSPAIFQYDVGVGGALTPKTPATVTNSTGAIGIAISPDGKSAYVGSFGNTVSQYDIGAGGALTPKNPATVTAGSGPGALAVSPDGKSVYVANVLDNTITQFDVQADGTLTPKSPATVATGQLPQAIVVSPDGKSAYVVATDDDAVYQYNVATDGTLTPTASPTLAAGTNPVAIAVSPVPSVHSTATSVSCSPGTFAPGDVTACTARVTDTASSGQSTPSGTVSFTSSGAGAFLGSPCTLSGSGVSASCGVFFTSFAGGGRFIEASYGGDATHSASSAIAGVTVAVPVSTAGCVVFGHGRITAANGDKASFRGLAAASPPRGVEFYRDNGPANAMRVASTSVDALTCSADATHASVFGMARINRSGSVEYRIDVQLTAWQRGKDTYRIRLSNGYDSGAQKIRHSDVDIHIHSSEHHHHDANAVRSS